MSTQTIKLIPQPLTAEAFRPFGDVIEAAGPYDLINNGTTQKFPHLATFVGSAYGGRPCISIYRATPYRLPLTIKMLERHPLGTQLFMPLKREPFLIVVAPANANVNPDGMRAFITSGRQGINYHRGTWHYPLIALGAPSEFLIVDRAGQGNCDEFTLQVHALLAEPAR
jgi:ureidoglycolate lyase